MRIRVCIDGDHIFAWKPTRDERATASGVHQFTLRRAVQAGRFADIDPVFVGVSSPWAPEDRHGERSDAPDGRSVEPANAN